MRRYISNVNNKIGRTSSKLVPSFHIHQNFKKKKKELTAEMMSHRESRSDSLERKMGVAADKANRTGVIGVN